MARPIKVCKVCGAEYEYCISAKRFPSTFKWQDVACCPEHGSIYFAEIAKSRGEVPAQNSSDEQPNSNSILSDIFEDEDDEDEWDEDEDIVNDDDEE